MANSGVKSSTMVQEMVMMLSFRPSCVVTRTTGPDSISVKALTRFRGRMRAGVIVRGVLEAAPVGASIFLARLARRRVDCIVFVIAETSGQGNTNEDVRAFHVVADLRLAGGAGAVQYGHANARGEPSVHDDPSNDVQPPLANCVPSRWAHAHHRKSGAALAGDPAGRKDPCHERADRVVRRPGRHARRLSFS